MQVLIQNYNFSLESSRLLKLFMGSLLGTNPVEIKIKITSHF